MHHVPRLYIGGKLTAGRLAVDGEQAQRLAKVMRVRQGDEVLVFNGDGREWRSEVAAVERARVVLEVREVARQSAAPPVVLETWCGLVRPQRYDWMIEKATEAGADIIRPFLSERTMGTREASKARMERWERLAIEASEQCRRLQVPVIEPPAPFERLLDAHRGAIIVADAGGQSLLELATLLPAEGRIALVIGPEGGLTAEEAERARRRGALKLRLGPYVLRTETAAAVATAMVRAL
ncbi:16S rRNA (uracil(1498)-N(3))-methyltransferase [bacterium]|nr:16S rRNA (uracil(1498)-N(3))-methyltransferase [bacterium]